MSKRRDKLTLLIGGVMLLTAIAAGSIIGGLGPLQSSASSIIWSPPTPTATLAPAVEPTATERPRPTSAAVRATVQPSATSAPAVPTITPPPVQADTGLPPVIEYIVQPGDLLFGLAQRFNTTNDVILTLNPDIDPESLVVGTTLRIPNPAADAP